MGPNVRERTWLMNAQVEQGAWWKEFRQRMPICRRWAYFDHAAVAPLSGPAHRALAMWADEALYEGDTRWGSWSKGVEATRAAAARLLGASNDEVALVPNTTTGINLVSEGYPWQPGDNVVALAGEFPSNLYPWMHLESRGVECRVLPVEAERLDLDRLAEAIDGRTRIVSVSWVGYATGWRNDLDAIAELVHARGALLFVDAIQGLGVFPLDVRQTPIDFLAADGHKWLLGPEGAGVFYLRAEHLDRLRALGVGWHSVEHAGDYSRSDLVLKRSAARYEGGSQNMAGMLALGASLEMFLGYTVEAISQRILEVTDRCCQRLVEYGAQVVSCRDEPRKSGIVSFELPGRNPLRVRQRLLEQGVALAYRGGRLRLSPHAYTNDDDMERLIAALDATA